jgi:hypothetical protein
MLEWTVSSMEPLLPESRFFWGLSLIFPADPQLIRTCKTLGITPVRVTDL